MDTLYLIAVILAVVCAICTALAIMGRKMRLRNHSVSFYQMEFPFIFIGSVIGLVAVSMAIVTWSLEKNLDDGKICSADIQFKSGSKCKWKEGSNTCDIAKK